MKKHLPIRTIPYHLTKLDSGVRVLTVPMQNFESVSIAIWVGAGSRYEPDKIAGVSHFLEHMLFKGTSNRSSRQIRLEIEGVGGMLNAFTGEESTCYFTKLLRAHLAKGLEVLSDMICNANLSSKELEKERAVILEEIRMYQDLPSHCVHEEMTKLLWGNHPLGRPVSGSAGSVSSLTREDLFLFKEKYYQNHNIIVSVAGDVRHEDVLKLAEKFFHAHSKANFTKKVVPVRLRQSKPTLKILTKSIEQTHLVIGFRTFSRFHPSRYKLALLNVILGANMSSRLFEVVREQKGLAYEIRSSTGYYQDSGYLTISAGVDHLKIMEVIEVVLAELGKIKNVGVKPAELHRAKEYFHSHLRMALEDTLDHLLWVGERIMEGDALPDLNKIDGAIQKVSVKDIQDVAHLIFTNKNLNLSVISSESIKQQEERIRRSCSLN